MKTFIIDIIPKIQKFSQRLDNLVVLTNKHWVVFDENANKKIVFIFREKDNQLLISENGKIEKGTWEYLGNNSLLIDKSDGSFLFKHGFIDDNVLALKVDGKEEYALLVNEQKFDSKLNSTDSIISFLEKTYFGKKLIDIPKVRNAEVIPIIVNIEKQPEEKFEPNLFPELERDLKIICTNIEVLNKSNSSNIIIAFTRDHSIKADWKDSNPEITDIVVNRKIPLNVIENLFVRSQNNAKFRYDFEEYLRRKIQ